MRAPEYEQTSLRRALRGCAVAIAVAAVLLQPWLSIGGVPFVVINANDMGTGSLRQAIIDANGMMGPDTITFDPVFFSTPRTILLASSLPDVEDDLTITGPGIANLAIDGQNTVRIFEDLESGTTVEMSGMTLRNGRSARGSAIRSYATLVLKNMAILNNTTEDTGGGNFLLGGGIFHDGIDSGTITIEDSTISGNRVVEAGSSVFEGSGGGLFIFNALNSTITRSTISGNSASNFGGGIVVIDTQLLVSNSTFSGNDAGANGGAAHNESDNISSTITLINSTVTLTETGNNGGALSNASGTNITLQNTIVADQTAGTNCSGFAFSSQGNNLVSDATCFLNQMSDKPDNLNANLGPLAPNGGPTLTHALLVGSDAIDMANATSCALPPTGGIDQRSAPRFCDGQVCDIGAFETGCIPQGGACMEPQDCGAGLFCADGVCCDRRCDQPGEACDSPTNPGVCVVTAGTPTLSPLGLLIAVTLLTVVGGLAVRRTLHRE